MQTGPVSRPLPLTGAKNVRDLGGYPTRDGGVTARHVFLRADGLHNLTGDDIQALSDYGVRRVVDLRGVMERERQPDPVFDEGVIRYFTVALLDQMSSNGFQGPLPGSMSEVYRSLLDDSAPELGRVMRLLAEEREGAALFHCSAGKDRTGVTAMLLLKLAGVPDEAVVADYSATEGNMAELFARQKEWAAAAGIDMPDYLLQSRPEEMERTLKHLHTRYGGADAYLLGPAQCSPAEVNALRARLTGMDGA